MDLSLQFYCSKPREVVENMSNELHLHFGLCGTSVDVGTRPVVVYGGPVLAAEVKANMYRQTRTSGMLNVDGYIGRRFELTF